MARRLKSNSRQQQGVSLVEFAVAVSLFLPVLITIIYVVLEASYLYNIKANLDVASRKAARELAIMYGANKTQATQPKATNPVYTNTRIAYFVADNQQFDDPTFTPNPTPGTVTVTVHYPTNGAYGLPRFPNPDPLNLGSTFDLTSTSTFSLE
jgi:Flp pilus assembly protein TadG